MKMSEPSPHQELIEKLRDNHHLMQGDGLGALIETAEAAATALRSETEARVRAEAERDEAHHVLMSIDEHEGLVAKVFLDLALARANRLQAMLKEAEGAMEIARRALCSDPPHGPQKSITAADDTIYHLDGAACGNALDAIRQALSSIRNTPESDTQAQGGWVLLPEEPDDAMIEAGEEALQEGRAWGKRVFAADVYQAMRLAAAPPPSTPNQAEREG